MSIPCLAQCEDQQQLEWMAGGVFSVLLDAGATGGQRNATWSGPAVRVGTGKRPAPRVSMLRHIVRPRACATPLPHPWPSLLDPHRTTHNLTLHAKESGHVRRRPRV